MNTGTGLNEQNIRIKIDLTSFVGNISSFDNYRLLLDADGTFSTGAIQMQPVKGDITEKTVEFDVNMSLYSNYYFTIATTNLVLSPLSLKFTGFSIYAEKSYVGLEWTTADENNVKNFSIKRSQDGQKLEQIAIVAAKNGCRNSYKVKDSQPALGLAYYRIKQIDFDGLFTYTPVRTIYLNNNSKSLQIYPNPSSGNLAKLYKKV